MKYSQNASRRRPGGRELVATMRAHGAIPALISGVLHCSQRGRRDDRISGNHPQSLRRSVRPPGRVDVSIAAFRAARSGVASYSGAAQDHSLTVVSLASSPIMRAFFLKSDHRGDPALVNNVNARDQARYRRRGHAWSRPARVHQASRDAFLRVLSSTTLTGMLFSSATRSRSAGSNSIRRASARSVIFRRHAP